MGEKRYFWLKLFEDFFTSKRIKKLRALAGGDTYTIIYLKMQLKALKTEGYLYFDGIMDNFAEELALDLDEKKEDVAITINYLLSVGLLETNSEDAYHLPYLEQCTGSETAHAQRQRDYMKRKNEQKLLQASQNDASVTEECQVDDAEIEKEKEKSKRESKSNKLVEQAQPIIAHLNAVAGTAYKSNSKETLRLISARFRDGFLQEEFYSVIDKKWREWGGTDMERYMRPQTLFGTKMESYLNAPDAPKQKPKKGGQPSNNVDWDSLV